MIGFKIIFIGSLQVALWYPSAGVPSPVQYAYVQSSVVHGGPMTPGDWPLIVVSHGLLECSTAMTFLTESLASKAIVAVPNHGDASCNGLYSPGEFDIAQRVEEVNTVIQYFNRPRTIVAGHSAGGWTVSLTGASRTLLLSPSPRLDAEVYQSISAPVLFLYGDEEWFIGTQWEYWGYSNAPHPKQQLRIDYATHYSFTDKAQCRWYRTLDRCLRYASVPRRILEVSEAFAFAAD